MPTPHRPPEQRATGERIVGLLLLAAACFASPLFEWIVRERAPWYSLFLLWGLLIGAIWWGVGRAAGGRANGERR